MGDVVQPSHFPCPAGLRGARARFDVGSDATGLRSEQRVDVRVVPRAARGGGEEEAAERLGHGAEPPQGHPDASHWRVGLGRCGRAGRGRGAAVGGAREGISRGVVGGGA